jgi:hypothetical protein
LLRTKRAIISESIKLLLNIKHICAEIAAAEIRRLYPNPRVIYATSNKTASSVCVPALRGYQAC